MDFNFVSPIALLHMRDESYRFSVMQKLHLLEQQLLPVTLNKNMTNFIQNVTNLVQNTHVQWCQIENKQSPVYDMK